MGTGSRARSGASSMRGVDAGSGWRPIGSAARAGAFSRAKPSRPPLCIGFFPQPQGQTARTVCAGSPASEAAARRPVGAPPPPPVPGAHGAADETR